MFKIPVDNEMYLRILSARDAPDLFNITTQSKNYLRKWLPWVDDIRAVEDSETFIKSALQLQQEQKALTMGIFYEERVVGVAGFNALDFKNKSGFRSEEHTSDSSHVSSSYAGFCSTSTICRSARLNSVLTT